jgi:uncharacterized protein (TIGR02391 family)
MGVYVYRQPDGRVTQGTFHAHIHHKPPYTSRMEEVKAALREAWSWLISAGLLIPDDNGWCFVSRRGKRLVSLDDVRNYQNAQLLPKAQIHPVIAGRVYPAFLRGEYDTAIFQAFREVEIAIRDAAKLPQETHGRAVITTAFSVPNGPLTDKKIPKAEQEAMLNLFQGAFGFYRNSTGHRHVPSHPAGTAEVILFASQLLRIVDELK